MVGCPAHVHVHELTLHHLQFQANPRLAHLDERSKITELKESQLGTK